MTLRPRLLALALLLSPLPLLAADAPAKYRSAQEILDASPASDWHSPAPENLLYMDLDGGRVIIELAPQFAPEHAGNIRTLAREGFWNGTSIYRSQDNFVVQFGDADADDAGKAKPLGSAKTHLPAEFQRPARGLAFTALPDHDGWAKRTGFVGDFAVAGDGEHAWLAHCYGTVGAGRNNDEDSSIGAELYVVDGQSPRQLDDNITVVGRVVQGMELLSVTPRGPAPMGFYEKPELRTTIKSIQLASELPEAERPHFQVMDVASPSFAAYLRLRANRKDDFYDRPAGGVDLCNAPVPVRAAP